MKLAFEELQECPACGYTSSREAAVCSNPDCGLPIGRAAGVEVVEVARKARSLRNLEAGYAEKMLRLYVQRQHRGCEITGFRPRGRKQYVAQLQRNNQQLGEIRIHITSPQTSRRINLI